MWDRRCGSPLKLIGAGINATKKATSPCSVVHNSRRLGGDPDNDIEAGHIDAWRPQMTQDTSTGKLFCLKWPVLGRRSWTGTGKVGAPYRSRAAVCLPDSPSRPDRRHPVPSAGRGVARRMGGEKGNDGGPPGQNDPKPATALRQETRHPPDISRLFHSWDRAPGYRAARTSISCRCLNVH